MVLSILTALSAIMFFVLFAATKRNKLKTSLGIIFFVLFASGIVLSVINEKSHLGMVEKTTVKEEKIESLVPKTSILLKEAIDKSDYEMVIYKVPGKTKPQHTEVDEKYSVKIKQSAKYQQPILQTVTTKYQYKNKWLKYLFVYPNQNLSPVKVQQIFLLGSDFKVMTKQQFEEMKKQMVQQMKK